MNLLRGGINRYWNHTSVHITGLRRTFAWQHRADSRFASSQWETALLCNDVSHWLDADLKSALQHVQTTIAFGRSPRVKIYPICMHQGCDLIPLTWLTPHWTLISYVTLTWLTLVTADFNVLWNRHKLIKHGLAYIYLLHGTRHNPPRVIHQKIRRLWEIKSGSVIYLIGRCLLGRILMLCGMQNLLSFFTLTSVFQIRFAH